MAFVIGLLTGLVLGAAIAYFLAAQKANTLSASVQDLRRQMALAESEHERRLREATEQLRQDYAAQPPTTTTATVADSVPITSTSATAATPAAEENAATSVVRPSSASMPPTDLPPEPTPRPAMVELPVPAAIAAPTMPSSAQSPEASMPAPQPQTVPAPRATLLVTDPQAILAASYAPDVATRQEVAQAIARVLPTLGAPAQARWLPTLGRLARDANPTVRLSAIQALESVQPSKRLPLLRRALQDTDPAVVMAASAIVNQTKGRTKFSKVSKKRRLPKNR